MKPVVFDPPARGILIAFVIFAIFALSSTCAAVEATVQADSSQATAAPVCAVGAPVCAVAATQPSSSHVPLASQVSESDQAAGLVQEAVELALAGEPEAARQQLARAAMLDDQAANLAAAEQIIGEFARYAGLQESQRQEEIQRIRGRITRSLMAQAYAQQLEESGIGKQLRDKLDSLNDAFEDVSSSDSLEDFVATDQPTTAPDDSDEPTGIKELSVAGLAAAIVAVQEAAELLAGDESEFAQTFKLSTDALIAQLQGYLQAWQSVDIDTADGRSDGAAKLEAIEDSLADAMGDVKVMAATKPWRLGVSYARLLREQLLLSNESLEDQPWFGELVTVVEASGVAAIADAKWYDAFRAYSGLEKLREDGTYAARVKIAQRHVHVLNLYGGGDDSGDEEADEETDDEDPNIAAEAEGEDEYETPRWQEVAAGIDADMVGRVARQMNNQYVTKADLDYRKLIEGALLSLKVLAETPQAADSFPELADPDKNEAFRKTIQRELDNINQADRLDKDDLRLTLNSMIAASEKTVDIPAEVVAMEFANGFLNELDRHSSMIWPSDMENFRKYTMGTFTGVGIQISKEPGEPLKVITPLLNSPGIKAGLKTDDLILAVDGERTEKHTINELVHMIMGKKGTKVVLRVKSLSGKVRDVTITRGEISIHTVEGWRRRPGGEWDYMIDPDAGIGYIYIRQFTSSTGRDLRKALLTLKREGVKSLVLDMRSNPGGLLHSATTVVEQFIPSGKRVVSTKGRRRDETTYDARSGGVFLDGELIVLVNGNSASASEIVSGALKDHRRARVFGRRTFGKGSVQNVIPVSGRSANLKLTTAYYYLPSGRLLHKKDGDKNWGVGPDVEVLMTPRQIRRWMEVRRRTGLVKDVEPEKMDEDLAEQFELDGQLNTAVMMLKLGQLRQAISEVKVAM